MSHTSRHPNSARKALPYILAGTLATFALRLSTPVVASLIETAGPNWIAGAATLSAAYMAARAVAAASSGAFYDKSAAARLLPPASLTAMAALTLAYPLLPLYGMAVLRAAQGLLAGLTWPIVQVSLALTAPKQVRGRLLSIYFTLGSASAIAANAVYPLIASTPPLLQLSASSALFTLAALSLLKAPLAQPPREEEARGEAVVIAASLIIAVPSSFIFGELSYALLSRLLGIGLEETALLLAVVSAASNASSYALSWAADKGFERPALALAVALSLASPAALLAPPPWPLAAYISAMTGAASYKPLSRRYLSRSGRPGAAVGLVNAASNIGTAFGEAVIGLLGWEL